MTVFPSNTGQTRFYLFRNLPCMSNQANTTIFNFGKRQLAEIANTSGPSPQGLEYLETMHFLDADISLTPGETRDQLDVVLVPTTNCNMECGYCYLGKKRSADANLETWAVLEFIERMIDLTDKQD